MPPACSQKLDITLCSPRNYFVYTPLLPAAATGTVEERSIVEPIRRVLYQKGRYYEAVCTGIDPVARTLTCRPPDQPGLATASEFTLPYDILILGAEPAGRCRAPAGSRAAGRDPAARAQVWAP